MTEKAIEKRLVAEIKALGGLCLKWVCPGWSGVPDRICLLPGGHVIFVELKKPTGKMSPRQKIWRDKLEAIGCTEFVVYSLEDIAALKT